MDNITSIPITLPGITISGLREKIDLVNNALLHLREAETLLMEAEQIQVVLIQPEGL